MMMYLPWPIRRSAGFGRLQDLLLQHLDRDAGWADRVDALLLVPLRAERIEDPRDHGRHVDPALRDLGDDDVGVVAVRGGDEGIGSLDPGSEQCVLLQPGPDRELTARVLPGAVEIDLEPRVRLGVLIETRHLMPLAEHRSRDGGTNPPTADDQDEHGADLSRGDARAAGLPSGSTTEKSGVVRPVVASPPHLDTSFGCKRAGTRVRAPGRSVHRCPKTRITTGVDRPRLPRMETGRHRSSPSFWLPSPSDRCACSRRLSTIRSPASRTARS